MTGVKCATVSGLTREIFSQPAFEPFRGAEISPGKDVQSDDEIDDFVREAVESAYHPSGTCRMGTDDEAVVDPETRVRGIDGLRDRGFFDYASDHLGQSERTHDHDR